MHHKASTGCLSAYGHCNIRVIGRRYTGHHACTYCPWTLHPPAAQTLFEGVMQNGVAYHALTDTHAQLPSPACAAYRVLPKPQHGHQPSFHPKRPSISTIVWSPTCAAWGADAASAAASRGLILLPTSWAPSLASALLPTSHLAYPPSLAIPLLPAPCPPPLSKLAPSMHKDRLGARPLKDRSSMHVLLLLP
eukprot:1150190-Pelagomonas_calceolata.AAC.12